MNGTKSEVLNEEKLITEPVPQCDEETAENEPEEILSEDIKKERHEEAKLKKEEGNVFFKKGEYEVAIDLYNQGVEKCPQCFVKTLSILHSNRAASYMKVDEKKSAIADCDKALQYDHHYTKARLRRAELYEATERLEDALKDYNEILSYDKSCQVAGNAAMRLPGQINERNEKLKAEMFSKLKDLGNMCLKPFGLSTDNFKVNQDPNSGGYSVNFQQ